MGAWGDTREIWKNEGMERVTLGFLVSKLFGRALESNEKDKGGRGGSFLISPI